MREYVPKEVQAKLDAARHRGAAVETERRVVTILFCDVKGSTSAAERLDPEEWAEIMNDIFGVLIGPVYRYEGVLARLMGDAILAFFGAPIAHEDDPERAVLAALEIVAAVAAQRERLRREHGVAPDVRVGINTGLVVVGEVGSDLRVEYTAMGDAVNLAARMEQTATAGSVRISEDTHRLVAPLFECEALGEIDVKGKAEAVRAYRVLGRKAEPGRLRGIAGREAPLVGRQRELATLREALAAARAGRGGIVSVIGEAGLGKSRLLAELRREAGDARWFECRGVSYDAARPYGLFQQLIRQMCEIDELDQADAVRAKIEKVVGADPRAARAFEILLGVEREQDQELAGEALKREIQEVMTATVRFGASLAPALLVADDLHWADPASTELILQLLPLAHETRFLAILAFRPDPEAPSAQLRDAARAHERYVEVELEPLATADSASLVDALLSDRALAPDARRRILERSEGNPFFVEEVARLLLDQGEVSDVPDNLSGLLVARVDRLAEEPRRTLQRASVIGRSFQRRVLAAISEDAASALDGHLTTLRESDLVREEAAGPELTYLFKHALTRDAAYSTLSLRRRRQLHRAVGEALERLFADRATEIGALVGHHFYEALDPRAVAYETAAGDQAYRLYANEEAAAHYARAIARLDREAATAEVLSHLYLRRGRALELAARFAEAVAAYEELARLGAERGDGALELAAVNAHVTVRSVMNPVYDPVRAEALLARAFEITDATGDRAAQAKLLWNLMLATAMSGAGRREAVDYGERALAIAREARLPEQAAFAQHDLYHAYMAMGDVAGARRAIESARPLWRELDNKPMLADSLASASFLAYLQGDLDAAVQLAGEARAIASAIGNKWGVAYSSRALGHLQLDRGEAAAAVETMREMVATAREGGLTPAAVLIGADLAWARALLGDIAGALADMSTAAAEAPHVERFRAPVHAIQARIALRRGDVAGAEALVRAAEREVQVDDLAVLASVHVPFARIDLALARGDGALAVDLAREATQRLRGMGVRAYLPEALLLEAAALRAVGRESEARARLEEARGLASALGFTWALWRILAGLGDRDEARLIVRNIAMRAGEFRASFLALPEVSSLVR